MPTNICRLLLALALLSQTAFGSEEPFKLGTFEHDGEVIIGIVLRDQLVVDLARANASLERRRPLWVELPMPSDMNELIGRYEYGMRERIHKIVDALVPEIDGGRRPAYVHELGAVETLPPVQPGLILAAALNYWEHAEQMTTGDPAAMSDASALDVVKQRARALFLQRSHLLSQSQVFDHKVGSRRHIARIARAPRETRKMRTRSMAAEFAFSAP